MLIMVSKRSQPVTYAYLDGDSDIHNYIERDDTDVCFGNISGAIDRLMDKKEFAQVVKAAEIFIREA